jgi:creatinine amidohydrolase
MTMVADIAWDVVERKLRTGAAAILPIGAAAKEHGLHLPMGTDHLQAEWLAARLAAAIDALVWPVLTYGYYPAFRDFPGSISLSRPTFVALVSEVLAEISRWRPRRLYVLDTGLSTVAPVDEAIASADLGKVVHLKIHDGPRYTAAAERLREQAFGSHADELETSRMLAMAPAVVDMSRAAATPKGPFHGALTRANAPSGCYGDPTLASAAKGQELLDAMLTDLVEMCR